MAASKWIQLKIDPKPRQKEAVDLGQRLSIESDF
jgi:hypothetical protein